MFYRAAEKRRAKLLQVQYLFSTFHLLKQVDISSLAGLSFGRSCLAKNICISRVEHSPILAICGDSNQAEYLLLKFETNCIRT